jgi:hypothetical protein
MPKTIIYNPDNGPDIPQGDLLLTNLRHPVFGTRWKDATPKGQTLRTAEGLVRLLEGEVTGHHHEIVFGSKNINWFRDDAMAHDLAIAAPVTIGTAVLVMDNDLMNNIISSDHFDPRRTPQLIIGFLEVTGGPVELAHPEHDTWRIPQGLYYVGRQIESAGADERAVQD